MNARRRLLALCAGTVLALPSLLHAQDTVTNEPPATAAPVPSEQAPSPPIDAAPAELSPAPESPPAPAELPPDEQPTEEMPVELSEAELASLGLSADAGEPPLDTSLRFWGFADLTFDGLIRGKDSVWAGILGRYPSFYIGNFNLYLAKNLSERIRTMGEVRFAFAPNGVPDSRTGMRTSTMFTDYAGSNQNARWGGVMIQRIYVEATLHELAVLRLGQFLTPYGIWNIDHGSPTIIPVGRPSMLNQNLFPEMQTGVELFGRARAGSSNVLGYHLTLSNGFGPVSEYRDLDGNKAVGGRVYWQFDKLGQLQIGGSAFYGRDTASYDAPGVDAKGKVVYNETITRQSDVLSLAADVRWTFKGLLLQTEIVSQQRKYTDDGRIGAINPLLGGRWVSPQDDITWGAYGLAGYRFERFGIMPYAIFSNFKIRDPRSLSNIDLWSMQGGLNIRPIDAFVLKLEYSYAGFRENFLSTDPVQRLATQVAWAF